MSSSPLTTWTTIAALSLTFISVAFAGIQVALFRKDLRHQTDVALYSYIFEWDRLLIERPGTSQLLFEPSPSATLTSEERRLAEYRLDLEEFAFRMSKGKLYEGDANFLDGLVQIPLIRKAILSGELEGSLRPEFLALCKAILAAKVPEDIRTSA